MFPFANEGDDDLRLFDKLVFPVENLEIIFQICQKLRMKKNNAWITAFDSLLFGYFWRVQIWFDYVAH
jgi:hypothetical protein